MKRISSFNQYLREDLDTDNVDKYSDLKEELTEMIKTSLKSEDDKIFNDFLESFVKSPNETKIEGLINDSDIYEFYLKWRNDVDDVLSDINYFDEVPSEKKVFSLYEYIIKGTLSAAQEVVSMIKK